MSGRNLDTEEYIEVMTAKAARTAKERGANEETVRRTLDAWMRNEIKKGRLPTVAEIDERVAQEVGP